MDNYKNLARHVLFTWLLAQALHIPLLYLYFEVKQDPWPLYWVPMFLYLGSIFSLPAFLTCLPVFFLIAASKMPEKPRFVVWVVSACMIVLGCCALMLYKMGMDLLFDFSVSVPAIIATILSILFRRNYFSAVFNPYHNDLIIHHQKLEQ